MLGSIDVIKGMLMLRPVHVEVCWCGGALMLRPVDVEEC